MDGWPSPLGLPNPRNRVEVEQWFEQRAQVLADVIAVQLNRIVRDAYNAFLETLPPQTSLTAAGDLGTFLSIEGDWNLVVQRFVLPQVEETYFMGSVSAFTQAPGTRRMGRARVAAWTDVVNQQAIDYVTNAQNRMRDVGRTVWNDVRTRTANSIAAGMTNEELKDQIQKVTGFSEYRADTIARTETNAAYINGDWAAAQALGEFGPAEKVWVATGDARTRVAHLEVSDTSVPMNEPFDVDGESMMFPHDPSASAANVVNCRCYVEFLYVGDTRPDGSVVQAVDAG